MTTNIHGPEPEDKARTWTNCTQPATSRQHVTIAGTAIPVSVPVCPSYNDDGVPLHEPSLIHPHQATEHLNPST